MVTTQLSAQDLFRNAYENRYTWNQHFPGYKADVTYQSGNETFIGKVHVSADLQATVTGINNEKATKAIQSQLFEIAIHRIRRLFQDTHGHNTFRYGQIREDGAVEILMGGKAEGDRYEIRHNQVSMVHRHIHGVVVTIHTLSSHDTGEGYLSHRYKSVYHDPRTGEQQGGYHEFEDEYENVGSYFLLSRRRVCTEGEAEQQFSFGNFQLLN